MVGVTPHRSGLANNLLTNLRDDASRRLIGYPRRESTQNPDVSHYKVNPYQKFVIVL